jgi:uncharacterized SAM-binding protein YcdF (DUF218 family)
MIAKPRRRSIVFLVALSIVVGCVAFWALRRLGRWLVDGDPLQHGQAIVVLSGKSPFRAMEAAEIYRQGWASEVWLLQDETVESDVLFAKLGIPHPSEWEYDQRVLERLGVPKNAIRTLSPPTTNTVSETRLIAGELRRTGGGTAIVVTSPVHTRRAKAIWRIVVGNHPQAIFRFDTTEPTDPDHWWRTTGDVQAVAHEALGLINAHLGFIAEPAK